MTGMTFGMTRGRAATIKEPPMPSRAEMEADAERRIAAQLEKHGGPMAKVLAMLQPLEAVAMVCFLADAALARFSAKARMGMAEAMTKTITEDAQDTVDAAGNARRD
jgi:hypothetical protein